MHCSGQEDLICFATGDDVFGLFGFGDQAYFYSGQVTRLVAEVDPILAASNESA